VPEWKKIKAEYIRGGITYRQLAAKYEVSFTNLAKLAKKKNGQICENKQTKKPPQKS
jgi:cytidylate kinase